MKVGREDRQMVDVETLAMVCNNSSKQLGAGSDPSYYAAGLTKLR
jgi:hypothetical protein